MMMMVKNEVIVKKLLLINLCIFSFSAIASSSNTQIPYSQYFITKLIRYGRIHIYRIPYKIVLAQEQIDEQVLIFLRNKKKAVYKHSTPQLPTLRHSNNIKNYHGLLRTEFEILEKNHPKFLKNILKWLESPEDLERYAKHMTFFIRRKLAYLTHEEAILFGKLKNNDGKTLREIAQQHKYLNLLLEECLERFDSTKTE